MQKMCQKLPMLAVLFFFSYQFLGNPQEYGAQGYGAHVWAMRYRGMGHMANGA